MRRNTSEIGDSGRPPGRLVSGGTTFFTRLFNRYLPDPYVIAVLLTVLTWILAAWLAPHNDFKAIIGSWYKGVFDIGGFAFLVALMLVTGYALSVSRPVSACLQWLASIPQSTFSALTLTIFVTMIVSLLHWAVGLIVAGLLAKEVARKVQVDYAWLVAAAYSGFGVFSSGLSCSVQLISAMHGSPLNIVEKVTGQPLSLAQTVFGRFNVIPVVVLAILLPVVFYLIRPKGRIERADYATSGETQSIKFDVEPPRRGVAGWLERSAWVNLILVAAFSAHFAVQLMQRTFQFDFTTMIVLFFALGLVLHGSPKAYIKAFGDAAGHAGGVLLQFPLYGGIMGVMLATGLAGVIAHAFTTFASPLTLPF